MPDVSSCYPLMGVCFSNKIDLALIATILIFMLGIFYNSHREREKQHDARKRYLLGLKEEIALNIRNLQSTIAAFPPKAKINAFLKAEKKNRPLMTFSYYSIIYRNRTDVLQDLPDILIRDIVDFYGKLESLAVNVSSIEGKAFETISGEGREYAFQSLP